jgi:hypothetical protein
MVLAIVGTAVLLGGLAFLEWKGGRRPAWHWAVMAISVLAVSLLVLIWIGMYRYER